MELVKNKQTLHEKIMTEEKNKHTEPLKKETYRKVLKHLKKNNKKMFRHINKAGQEFQDAMFEYMADLVNNETVPEQYDYTKLFGLWKGKGNKLDLNMQRYIHGKDWDAKLLEALVSERMKPVIIANCPKIQIGGIKNNSSSEHLIVLKTWMKTLETQNKTGIFQAFDMEKNFDKEGLVDTLNTVYTIGKISGL